MLDDWTIFELYQLLLVYCMFNFMLAIYADLTGLLFYQGYRREDFADAG